MKLFLICFSILAFVAGTKVEASLTKISAYAQVGNPGLFIIAATPGAMWGPLSFRYKTDWKLASETRYIYDGMLPIQERDGNNVPRVTYTRGRDFSGTLEGAGGIGGLLARTDHSTLTPTHAFYHADGSGNVTTLINWSQAEVASYLYDPFGNTLKKTGPLADANALRFSSKPIHAASGMYDYGRRWYEPNLQRWLNEDPIEEAGGLNLYAFAGNSSLNRIDPFGEAPPLVAFCAAAAIDYVAEKSLDFVGNNMVPDQHQETFDKVRSAYDTLSALTPAKTGRKMAGEVMDAAKNAVNKLKKGGGGNKRGPKTDPTEPHNAIIRSDAEKLKTEGNKILAGGGGKEAVVPTPGGFKEARRPDTIYETPEGQMKGRNYGKTRADGTPAKRECEALDDLNNRGDLPTDFLPYDR